MIRQKLAIHSLSTYSLSAQLACGDGGAHCHVARRAFGADGQVTISTDGRNSIGSRVGRGMVGGATLASIRYLFCGMLSLHGSDLHGQARLSPKI